jgi:hypothetical protein
MMSFGGREVELLQDLNSPLRGLSNSSTFPAHLNVDDRKPVC